MATLNIILAFGDLATAQKIKTLLASEGIYVSGSATSVSRALALSKLFKGKGLVICQKKLPDGPCLELIDNLDPDYYTIVLAKGYLSEIAKDVNACVLPLPVRKTDLADTVRMFLSENIEAADNNKSKSKKQKKERSPEEINLIEKAKAVLIERNNFTEERAHRFLQKKSMDSGMALSDVAMSIIERW